MMKARDHKRVLTISANPNVFQGSLGKHFHGQTLQNSLGQTDRKGLGNKVETNSTVEMFLEAISSLATFSMPSEKSVAVIYRPHKDLSFFQALIQWYFSVMPYAQHDMICKQLLQARGAQPAGTYSDQLDQWS